MPDSINITALAAYAEQYKAQLITKAMTGTEDIQKHFNLIPGITDKYIMTNLQMKKILKPYRKSWDPDSDKGKLIPRTLRVELGQVELEEEPQAYRKTYLGTLLKGAQDTRIPFEQYLLEAVMKQIASDINTDLLFYGDRDANGTLPGDVNDGFFTIIADEKAAGNISTALGNQINIGAVTSSNAVAQMKKFYRGVNKAYWGVPVKMYMSWDIYNKYVDDYQASVGSVPYNTEFKKTFLEGSANLCELVPLTSMGDAQMVIIAPQENMAVGVDLASDQEKIIVRQGNNPKTIQIYSAMAWGAQIASLRAFWCTDGSAGTTPSGSGSSFV